MNFIKSFEEYFNSNESDYTENDHDDHDELLEELEDITEEELNEFLQTEYLTEAEKDDDFKLVTGQKLSGDTISLTINSKDEDGNVTSTKYKFEKPGADIKEIFRKFEKMMGFSKMGGKALAWLHKQVGKGTKID